MGLRDEIGDWRQPDGLIAPKSERPGTENPDTTGDGIKHFSMYHGLLVKRGESRPSDLVEFETVIRSCYVRPGLPHRSPTKTGEQVSKDAIGSAAYAGKKLGSAIPYEILNLGNSMRWGPFKWFYPNLFPERFEKGGSIPFRMIFTVEFWSAWMGKNPEVVAHLQWCGLPPGHTPHILRIIYQGIYFLVVKTGHTGLNSFNQEMVEAAYGHNSFLDLCMDVWVSRINYKWPGGLKQSLTEELEPQHPNVRYWR